MMNYNKLCAGMFAGVGALFLIYTEHFESGVAILSAMVGFFVGDANGKKTP